MTNALPHNRITNLSVWSGSKQIINDLNFELHANNIYVVLGPGGSGKSVLTKLLTNQNTLGSLRVEGNILNSIGDYAHMRQDVKEPALSLKDHLKFNDPFSYVRKLWGNGEVSKHLKEHFETPVNKLPAELVKPVQLTFSMQNASESQWLFFDEPEVNSDSNMTAIAEVIKSLKKDRVIIVNTHHIAFARQLADYILLIIYGQPKFFGPAKEFYNSPETVIQNVLNYGI